MKFRDLFNLHRVFVCLFFAALGMAYYLLHYTNVLSALQLTVLLLFLAVMLLLGWAIVNVFNTLIRFRRK